MDSVVLAYFLKNQGYELSCLSFNYGQRHAKELGFAEQCAKDVRSPWHLVDLSTIQGLLPGSSLTDSSIEVPEGHFEAEIMKATVVPNRNAIMLSIAWGHAVAIGADVVAFGAHAGDHAIYPDCRPEFWEKIEAGFKSGNEGFGNPELRLYPPFIKITKADITKRGYDLGVNYAYTWSCYKGGEKHCGKCGTCVERKEAFELAGVPDPTVYE
jgi:7-cyano-7-deazaguanine synthase